MSIILGIVVGFIGWFLVRYLLSGIYTVNQDQRAVKTIFGRAERVGEATILDDPIADHLKPEERDRYDYPQVRMIPPGGPYFKWRWEKIYKVHVSTQTANMAHDPERPRVHEGGKVVDEDTKDQLNTGVSGQSGYRDAEKNL